MFVCYLEAVKLLEGTLEEFREAKEIVLVFKIMSVKGENHDQNNLTV